MRATEPVRSAADLALSQVRREAQGHSVTRSSCSETLDVATKDGSNGSVLVVQDAEDVRVPCHGT
jgi:hypothetical protein